uniref:Uncharacterized protein n=1 Tax=Plectus sambesii TaxID=2011161 RepID=A0A914XKY8_9BILA
MAPYRVRISPPPPKKHNDRIVPPIVIFGRALPYTTTCSCTSSTRDARDKLRSNEQSERTNLAARRRRLLEAWGDERACRRRAAAGGETVRLRRPDEADYARADSQTTLVARSTDNDAPCGATTARPVIPSTCPDSNNAPPGRDKQSSRTDPTASCFAKLGDNRRGKKIVEDMTSPERQNAERALAGAYGVIAASASAVDYTRECRSRTGSYGRHHRASARTLGIGSRQTRPNRVRSTHRQRRRSATARAFLKIPRGARQNGTLLEGVVGKLERWRYHRPTETASASRPSHSHPFIHSPAFSTTAWSCD